MAIVMKSAVRVRFVSDEVAYEYFLVDDPLKPHRVSKDVAMRYIEKYGLQRAYTTPDGVIWDTPDQVFREKFRGMGSRKEDAREIDKAWLIC